ALALKRVTMKVSVGILARNEADNIAKILGDIGSQDLLSSHSLRIEIHIVANGCTDSTVIAAKNALSKDSFQHKNIKVYVHTLSQPVKSNAWNELIHRFTSPAAEFICLVDADIRIPEPTTLRLMLDSLVVSDKAVVAVDDPVKDLSLAVPT